MHKGGMWLWQWQPVMAGQGEVKSTLITELHQKSACARAQRTMSNDISHQKVLSLLTFSKICSSNFVCFLVS
jgi:hypothetical protein